MLTSSAVDLEEMETSDLSLSDRPLWKTPPMVSNYDVIVIGGGVLGSAAAATLGAQGRSVLLVERDWSEPDRIVGELLQPGGVEALQILGLEDCLLNMDAIPVNGYVVFRGTEQVKLSYPKNSKPNVGFSFHHGRFISNLRRAARKEKNVTCIEATAKDLVRDTSSTTEKITGLVCSFKGPSSVSTTHSFKAPLTIVADGCFSKFRKEVVTKSPVAKSHFVGLVLKDLDLPVPNHGHVILADPSPILLYQIGTRDTRILVDIPGPLPSAGSGALKAYMSEFVGPQLPKQIQASFYAALETDRLRAMPNAWLPPSLNLKPGVLVLGDALNMRHPLTGGGMTVALWDVVHVSRGLQGVSSLSNITATSRLGKELYWTRKSSSTVVNVLANALYALFSAGSNTDLNLLQAACFGYFQLGGRCASTPVGLLAGLIREPLTLIGHFFAVALFAIVFVLRSEPVYKFPLTVWKAGSVLWTACTVIGPLLLAEVTG